MTDRKDLRIPCPRCGIHSPWTENPHRPFCSERCRLIDLGRWADEEYRVAGAPIDPETLANVVEFPRKD